MGLSSVFSTAVTGIQAAETSIDVTGNNVANANTIGFKQSQVEFATQFLQTLSLGSAPTPDNGGTNPRQVGLGVQVSGITPDFSQGTLQLSSSPSHMAIQGNGMFIVQSQGGENLYTRNGQFQTNSDNQLVNSTGQRLLGYGVDNNYNVDTSNLVPLSIPLGTSAVAEATKNVNLEGTLTPTGDVATTAAIIQSGPLGDSAESAPAGGTTANLARTPDVLSAGTTLTAGAGGALTTGDTYSYKVVFADGPVGANPDNESLPSQTVGPVTLAAGQNQITLNNLPTDPSGIYQDRRIYRSNDGGATYQLVTDIPNNTTTSYTDTTADASLGQTLNTTALTGNYSYYVVYANAVGGPGNGITSRPSPLVGPINVVNGRVQLQNLPVDSSGQWTVRRIYRCTSTDSGNFEYVGEIPNMNPGITYTDSTPDSAIQNNPQIDFTGPRVNTNTLLTNVLQFSNGAYSNLFQLGTLTFTGTKGGKDLNPQTFQIKANSTVLDLTNFIQQAMGIQTEPGPDPLNPIPSDSSGANPGVTVNANGQIVAVGNNGVDNAVSIGLSAFQETPAAGGAAQSVNLDFSQSQAAVGQSAVGDVVVYDSLGIPLNVRVTAVLQSRTATTTTYRWFADSPQNDPLTGNAINVGTGLVTFDGQGKFVSATNSTVAIDRAHVPSAKPLDFNLNFAQVSGLAASTATLQATSQDGFPPGKLTSYKIGEDGIVTGVFDNGTQRTLGQIELARFANPAGLDQRGQNLYATSTNSGLPVVGAPNSEGIGSIVSGSLEQSNADVGSNLINLILSSTAYQANTQVINTTNQLMNNLLLMLRNG